MSLPSSEQWRPVPGYEGRYEVSDYGRVRSLLRGAPRVLRTDPDRNGYLRVRPADVTGRKRATMVHRLVLNAFVGPCPDGQEGRHLNGNNQDNRLTNLAYATHSVNILDKLAHGTHTNALKTHCPRGHEYTPENTRVQVKATTASRKCRACERDRDRDRVRLRLTPARRP